jgi:lysophospholipase L1-like esterase
MAAVDGTALSRHATVPRETRPNRAASGRSPRTWPLAAASTLLASLTALLVAELVVLPWQAGVPREVALLGLAAQPPAVDDTAINSLGFTGDVPSEQKPRGTRRVLTLGASSLFNRRLTERLKAQIAARAQAPVEVVGGAIRTHTSRANVLKYRFFSKYQFDYVFLYEGINDLWANHVAAERFRGDYAHLSPWHTRNFLLDNSLIARVVYNRLTQKDANALEDFLAGRPRAVVNGAGFRSAAALDANLRELIAAIRSDGGVPILMTFAWVIPDTYTRAAFEAGTLGYVNPDNYDRVAVEMWGPADFVREGLLRHDAVVRAVARDTGTPLLDQRKLMDDRIELFGDVCHFNETGTDEFVRHMVDFLVERGFI